MRAVVQRSLEAKVTIEGNTVGTIDHGFVVLLGVGPTDTEAESDYLAEKISKLRVFSDPVGKCYRFRSSRCMLTLTAAIGRVLLGLLIRH